jgi:ActD protein
MSGHPVYGVIGEFATPTGIIAAARQLGDSGFRHLDAYTPYPVETLDRMLGRRRPWLPLVVLAGTILGAFCGYFVQIWAASIDYPLNIGGRPYDSWPAFTVSAFEITVLFALTAGFVAFLIGSRLPLYYHPVFTAGEFDRASQDRFFLCVEAADPRFDAGRVGDILRRHGAERVQPVHG